MDSAGPTPKQGKKWKLCERSPAEELIIIKGNKPKVQRENSPSMTSMDAMDLDSEDEEEIALPDNPSPDLIFIMKRFDRLDRRTTRIRKDLNKKIVEVDGKVDANAANITKNDTAITAMQNELEVMKLEIKSMRSENEGLKRRVITNEQVAYRENLIFYGFPEEADKESTADCIEKIIKILNGNLPCPCHCACHDKLIADQNVRYHPRNGT